MTAAMEQSATSGTNDRLRRQNRMLRILIIVLVVIAVGLGGVFLYATATGDDLTSVPEDVQALLDEFQLAMETNDYEAMQALVTENFRRPFYQGDPAGIRAWREVWTIEDFDFFETETMNYDIERVGDPIVRGDGPWFVSVAENWMRPEVNIQYEVIYTFAIVDEDGTLGIDDAYWVGQPGLLDSEP